MKSVEEMRRKLHDRKRRGEAREMRVVTAAELNGFIGEYNECHKNVARWCAINPKDAPVRGWLISGGIFDKHSVVRTSDGVLIDVTPRRDDQGEQSLFREFMTFNGTQEGFEAAPAQIVDWEMQG